jgi:nucleoside-diphosphate-sugar epimerase
VSVRVAVTGATGFIGGHVVRRLAAAGWHVRAVTQPGRRWTAPPGVEVAAAPLVAAELTRACAGADVVVHLAALTRAPSARELRAVNVEGTREVARAAAALGARLVHVSSLAAGGPGTSARPRREDDAPAPITAYGRSKLEAEVVVAATSGLRWTIVRPALVYGPGDRNALPLFRLARRGLALVPPGAGAAWTFIHAEDVARAIERAAASPSADGQSVALGHPRIVTAEDLEAALAAAVGRRLRRVRVPGAFLLLAAAAGELAWRLGRPLPVDRARLAELRAPGWVCSVDRARERLGFEARIGLADGFADTARWYAQRGWL